MEDSYSSSNEPATSVASAATLPDIKTLLRQSYDFTKARLDLVGWYIGISILALIVFVLPVILAGFLYSLGGLVALLFAILVLLVGWAGAFWVMVVASGALMYAAAEGEQTRFKAGWQWAKPRFWSIAWIGLLLALVLLGGFSLLIIPAVAISFYTLFYFMAFIRQNVHGIHALAASTHVVYGRFWSVVWRIVAAGIIITLINFAVVLLFEGLGFMTAQTDSAALVGIVLAVGEIIGIIISLFLTVLMMRYIAILHTALQATAPAYQEMPLNTSYKVYRALAGLGIALLLVGAIAAGVLWNTLGASEALQNYDWEANVESENFEAELEADLEQMFQEQLEGGV